MNSFSFFTSLNQLKQRLNKPVKSKVSGLTLTELLVVMVIIGILVLLALPSLMPLVTKAKSTEAKIQLEHLYKLQKSHFMEHSKYGADLKSVGFEQEKLTTENGKANYLITIEESSNNTFRAKATAVADFDGDGTFNVWEIDHENNLKETTQD